MKKEYKRKFTYRYGDLNIFSLGYAHYLKAQSPLVTHDHGNQMEFVYMERGSQKYQIADASWTVRQGEVFFTLPNEQHSTGTSPEEVSALYYLIVDLQALKAIDLFRFPEEYEKIFQFLESLPNRIYTPAPHLSGALKQLMRCFEQQGLHFDTQIRNALSEVMLALCADPVPGETVPTVSLSRSLRYIHEHPEEAIRVSQLPAMENLSLSAYNKHFLRLTGISPGEYILKNKVEYTKKLLEETELSVTEIAYQAGFSSSQYFATVFRRFCFTTPSEYRKQFR